MMGTKRIIIYLMSSILWVSIMFGTMTTELQAETRFVTIGSGDVSGIYFPTGLIIAKMINDKRDELGIRASVESTPGSVFNVNAIMAGYLEFGLVQSDKQYQAVKGLAEWSKKGPQKNLRAVFSIHHESVCLIAAADAGITTLKDLKGKRVNLGHPGAAMYQNAIDTLKSIGINPYRDILPEEFKATDAPRLLQDNRIDAFFYTVGHPNQILKEAVSGSRKVRFIPITGPNIDKLISEKKYYQTTIIPVKEFYVGSEDPVEIETFGVVATLCTSAQMPDDVVYLITKELFDNFDYFKNQLPAFANLTKEGMLKGLSAPIHPGALRYFSEAGLVK
jgi:TRAP transporter TAXI family solute receptor